jgi:PKD repeat protein
VTEYQVTYCESYGLSTSKGYIQEVQLSDLTNSSGDNGGYGDFTSNNITLESGVNYGLTLTPGYPNRPSRYSWRVWIDYNNDGDFVDSGELVYSADNNKNVEAGSFTVASGFETTTRMRVSMKTNSGATSCEIISNGEVEDYTVVIGPPVPQPPVANFSGTPTTVIIGNSVVFSDESQNNPTSWSWTFDGGVPATSTDQNPIVSYNTLGSYNVSLTVTNDVGTDSKTVLDYITVVEQGTSDYCSSQSTNTDLEYIGEVQIGGFSKPSGASFYSDFTGDIIGLAPGSNNSVTLTPTYSGSDQREFWRIWIDFNGDGDFDDADETVFAANNKKGQTSGTIDVPAYASGQTRMRVTMKPGGSPSPCGTFDRGEVEDYTVDFGNGPSTLVRNISFEMNIYPNPVNNLLNIELNSSIDRVYVRMYDVFGKILEEFDTTDKKLQLDLGNYPSGIYYLGAENGVDNTLKKFIKN